MIPKCMIIRWTARVVLLGMCAIFTVQNSLETKRRFDQQPAAGTTTAKKTKSDEHYHEQEPSVAAAAAAPPPPPPPPPPPIEFSIDLLGPEPIGACGYNKCYFPVAKNPSYGYIAMQLNRQKNGQPQRDARQMIQSWRFGQEMLSEYGMKHLMLGPVQQTNITAEQAALLNAHGSKASDGGKLPWKLFEEGTIMVQLQKTADAGSILYGCEGKMPSSLYKYNELVDSLLDDSSKRDEFRARVGQQLPGLKRAVDANPCFLKDLQILISPVGEFHFLDYDDCALKFLRSRPPGTEQDEKSCRQMIDYLQDKLDDKPAGPLLPKPELGVDDANDDFGSSSSSDDGSGSGDDK